MSPYISNWIAIFYFKISKIKETFIWKYQNHILCQSPKTALKYLLYLKKINKKKDIKKKKKLYIKKRYIYTFIIIQIIYKKKRYIYTFGNFRFKLLDISTAKVWK